MAGERWRSWLKKLKSGKHSLRRGLKSSTSTSTAEVNTILEDSFEEDDSFWCTFAYRHCWLMWTSSKAWTMHASESRRQRQLASYILNSFLKRKVHGARSGTWHMHNIQHAVCRHFPAKHHVLTLQTSQPPQSYTDRRNNFICIFVNILSAPWNNNSFQEWSAYKIAGWFPPLIVLTKFPPNLKSVYHRVRCMSSHSYVIRWRWIDFDSTMATLHHTSKVPKSNQRDAYISRILSILLQTRNLNKIQ